MEKWKRGRNKLGEKQRSTTTPKEDWRVYNNPQTSYQKLKTLKIVDEVIDCLSREECQGIM